jgi:SAM-dependent methyltransferase
LRGFDVSDSEVQAKGFLDEALETLAREIPGVDWRARVSMLTSTQAWPYQDASFDWVISNHVLEHVRDHELVFGQVERVLRPGGRSVHLFPVRESVLEGHLHIPCVHWIRDHDRMRGYIRTMTRLGFGNYRQHRAEDPSLGIERFAETRADFINTFTNYLTKREVFALAKRVGLRCSFRYTEHFLFAKLRQVLAMAPAHRVTPLRVPVLRALLLFLSSRLTSVTIVMEKLQSYHR